MIILGDQDFLDTCYLMVIKKGESFSNVPQKERALIHVLTGSFLAYFEPILKQLRETSAQVS